MIYIQSMYLNGVNLLAILEIILVLKICSVSKFDNYEIMNYETLIGGYCSDAEHILVILKQSILTSR